MVKSARIMAGVPSLNAALFRRIRFLVGDPVALIEIADGTNSNSSRSHLILRDIEMERARKNARVNHVHCPADFEPIGGLSGDRETATAQSLAELLAREQIASVIADRSLPMIYVDALRKRNIAVDCDLDWGVVDRRKKDPQEIENLREAQRITELVMERACRLVANAPCRDGDVLLHEGIALTSERLRTYIDTWLLEVAYTNPESIVACGPQGADCHDHGHGPLRTGQPIIIDIFPRSRKTLYNGDCTRTVVHGEISKELARMHRAVAEAKHRAIAKIRPGVTGHEVHQETLATMREHGYETRLPNDSDPVSFTAITHGTGHGLGLEVHEPPLLAVNGPALIEGDVVTVEPGLYSRAIGGIRIEDVVVVTSDGCMNLNQLPEGLDWRN